MRAASALRRAAEASNFNVIGICSKSDTTAFRVLPLVSTQHRTTRLQFHNPTSICLPRINCFSTSQCLLKKGGKAAREEKQTTSKEGPADDLFDFTNLESDIDASIERLKTDLSKLRSGGRFNPEILENLRVQPDKNDKQMVKLSDLAQVIPKGRQIQLMVGEKDHIKPITTTIQTSGLSLTPQPDPTGTNPLLLVINIPPPTAESRKAAVAEATKAGEKAATSIRDARGKQQKKLRGMQLDKNVTVRPDDVKKAGTLMEKVVEKGVAEAKRIVEQAKKVLESG